MVRVREGCQLAVDDLAAHVKRNMDVGVAPDYFKIVSDFPMTRSGKVQKFKLADEAQKEYLNG